MLLVGLDAFDPALLEHWAGDGSLPHLGRLLESGLRGAVANPTGLYVGAVWPSFATGTSPARHGRYCFRQLVAGSYAERYVSPAEIGVEPFWAALGRAGKRVAIVDIPKMPPCAAINGVHVVDWGTHDRDHDPPVSVPAREIADLHRRFGRDPVGNCDAHGSSVAEIAALLERLEVRIAAKTEMVLHLLGRERWDLLAVVYGDSHCAGHQLWHLHDRSHPCHDPAIAAALGDPLRRVYVALDAHLGRLLAAAGDDCVCVILASHGMGPHYDATHLLDEILARLDGAPFATGRDGVLAPIRRLWRTLPAPVARALRPLRRRFGAALESLPLARRRRDRRFFAVPNNDAWGAVRVNVAGREPNGMVRPGSELEGVLDRLERDLGELVNGETGTRLVRSIVRADSLFRGPARDALPDLLIEWSREAPIAVVTSPLIGTLRGRYDGIRTGDHRADGMFLAVGAGIVPGRTTAPVAVEDFAPTFANLLGVPLPGVDGRPIEGLA